MAPPAPPSARARTDEPITLIKDFKESADDADLRERVLNLAPVLHGLRALGKALVPDDIKLSGRDRILRYLRRYPLKVIDGDELLIISGIGDWPRRVRELRVELGWPIYSGVTFKDMAEDEPAVARALETTLGIDPKSLRPDQYVLT